MTFLYNSFRVFTGSIIMLSAVAQASDLSQLEGQVTSLQDALTVEQKKVSKLRAELEAARATSDHLLTESKPTKVDSKADAELAELRAAFSAYKQEYRDYIRQKAPGMILKDQTLVERNFPQLKVRSVDDTWFTFEHEGGFARVFMGDVSQELRDLFACEQPLEPTPVAPPAVVAEVQALPTSSSGGDSSGIASAGAASLVSTYPEGTASFNPRSSGDNSTMSVRSDVKLPPRGKTADGNDIIYENGKAIIILTKHLRNR